MRNTITMSCLSSIYGAFLGDAMGAYCEFIPASTSNSDKIFVGKSYFKKEAGEVTDDSEMAISLAYAIMDNPILYSLHSAYDYFYYGMWFNSNPVDIGQTTRTALQNIKQGEDGSYKFDYFYFNLFVLPKFSYIHRNF